MLLLLAGTLLGTASPVQCQALVDQVLISFPAETSRVEYARPSELRRLPQYEKIRTQSLGLRLRELKGALSSLGIAESDIDEVALAWTPRRAAARVEIPIVAEETPDDGTARVQQMPTDLSGLLMGRFDNAKISESARTKGGLRIQIHEVDAYCLPKTAGACLAVLSPSLAAFGESEILNALIETRLGLQGSLGADRRFTDYINQVNRHAPIWGIATGQTVPEWFRGWFPVQSQAQLDWVKTLESVEAFTYVMEVGEKLELTARLHANSAEVAQRLVQLFSGLRTLLTLTWQLHVPDRPSPFSNLRVLIDGRVCILRLVGSGDDLMAYQGSMLNLPTLPQGSTEK